MDDLADLLSESLNTTGEGDGDRGSEWLTQVSLNPIIQSSPLKRLEATEDALQTWGQRQTSFSSLAPDPVLFQEAHVSCPPTRPSSRPAHPKTDEKNRLIGGLVGCYHACSLKQPTQIDIHQHTCTLGQTITWINFLRVLGWCGCLTALCLLEHTQVLTAPSSTYPAIVYPHQCGRPPLDSWFDTAVPCPRTVLGSAAFCDAVLALGLAWGWSAATTQGNASIGSTAWQAVGHGTRFPHGVISGWNRGNSGTLSRWTHHVVQQPICMVKCWEYWTAFSEGIGGDYNDVRTMRRMRSKFTAKRVKERLSRNNELESTYRSGIDWCALDTRVGTPASSVCHRAKQAAWGFWKAELGGLSCIWHRYCFPINRYCRWLRLHELAAGPLGWRRCASFRVCDLYSKRAWTLHLKNTKPWVRWKRFGRRLTGQAHCSSRPACFRTRLLQQHAQGR